MTRQESIGALVKAVADMMCVTNLEAGTYTVKVKVTSGGEVVVTNVRLGR